MERPIFSQKLAARRRELGLSTAQVADALRLKESVLVAFEEGDFASMPKSGYAQGMLSSYARYLQLDEREITGLFSRALDDYRHGGKTGRKPVSAQPMVGRRGLLPSSGGPAGDLGTFATTTVRNRSDVTGTIRTVGGYNGSTPYGGPRQSGRPSTLGQSRRATRSTDWGTGERTYTNQNVYDRGSRSAVERASRDIRNSDVRTVRPRPGEYVDDLSNARETLPYEGASTARGRQGSRNIASPERPNVQRRTSARQRQELRQRDDRKKGSPVRGFLASPGQQIFAVILGVALVIFAIMVVSIGSCGARRGTDAGSSVPVSETTTSQKTETGSSAQIAAEAQAAKELADESGKSDDKSTPTETKVAVSVADGAVTWLEIECDGSSKVAETITGPWSQTYEVTKSITVQAGDTSAVTITNNGQQVAFESRASGIGTVTIQGSGTPAQTETTTTAQTGKNSTTTTTTSDSEATATTQGDGGTTSTSASESGDGTSGRSAQIGGDTSSSSGGYSDSGDGSYSDGYSSGYSDSYSSGYSDYSDSYSDGYSDCSDSYSDGYSGYSDGDSYGGSDGYSSGYSDYGYSDDSSGYSDAEDYGY